MGYHVLYPDGSGDKWKGDPNVSITGSGFSVPRGVEAVLSYNNLVMNDLTVYDKFRVLSIDGLSDADIRDNREEKPGDDGEDAYKNLYAGRTIVIKVRVEAYQLDKLRDMEEALRTAFIDMEEKPLYFLTGDPEKDHYIMCKKSAAMTKEEDVSTINFRHFREWQITLRASDPRFYRSKGKSLTTLVDVVDPELLHSGSFEWASAINGWSLDSSSGAYTSGISTDWASKGTHSLKLTSSLQTTNTKKFQRKISGIQGGTSYTVSADFKQINEASTNFVSSTFIMFVYFLDSNNNILYYYFTNPRVQLGMEESEWSASLTGIAPSNASQILCEFRITFNRPYTFYADNVRVRLTNDFYNTKQAKIINIGNYNTSPIIKLNGGMSNISLHNDLAPEPFNNIKFKSGVSIPDGDYYLIDIDKRTIINQDGENKLGDLDKTSGWLKLYPGTNPISFGDSTSFTSSNAQFTIIWRDAWI